MRIMGLAGVIGALLSMAATAQETAKPPTVSPLVALLKQGLADLDRNDFTAAIKQFTKASKLGPDARPLFLVGLAHYERASRKGDPENADPREAQETVTAYEKAAQIDPGLKLINDKPRFYRSLAWSYEALKSYEKAATTYESAISADPKSPTLPLYAAWVYSRMGDSAKAAANVADSLQKARALQKEGLIRGALRDNPRYASMLIYPDVAAVTGDEAAFKNLVAQNSAPEEFRDAVSDRGPSLARELPAAVETDPKIAGAIAAGDEDFKFRQYRGAVQAYGDAARLDGKAQSLDPVQKALLYERLGTSYNRLGLSAEAIASLQAAIKAMPNDATAHYQLALAYATTGRFKDALSALDETFQSAPTAQELRRFLIQAKSDLDLEPVRDLPIFASLINRYESTLAKR